MTPFPILLAAVCFFSKQGTIFPKSFAGALSSNSRLDVSDVLAESVRALSSYFRIKFSWLEIQ